MEILKIFIHIFEIAVFAFLTFATAYIFIFGFAGLFKYKQKPVKNSKLRKFAVLIPGYKEDSVIVEVARDALNQNYPKEYYDVIVIADSFAESTLEALRKLPITVNVVSFEVSKKSKALNKTMEVIGDDYDVALILDADNIMQSDVIEKLNKSFDNGFVAVQGHRLAKNTNTSFAILDAISEEINNHVFRKGHRVLGLSSALIGSGMALEYKLFKDTMKTIDSVGEDKEVEMKLLKQKYVIDYCEDALVFDEKTQKSDVFVNQRRRWIAAQLSYFRDYFFSGLNNLIFKGNVDFFDKVLQMIQPPRIILLGLLLIFVLLSGLTYILKLTFIDSLFYLSPLHWLILLGLTIITLIFSIPRKFYNKELISAILALPKGFFMMFLSLLRIKGASKKFIHTTHSHTTDKGEND